MANYQLIKADIDAKVYQNGKQEITGENLNSVLNAMVASLGAGYQFMGMATPTNPGTEQTPDYKCFYLATTPGTYTNLGGVVVADGEVAILKYDTSWTKEVTGAATAEQVSQLGQQIEQIPLNLANGGINGSGHPVTASSRVRLDYFLNNTQGTIVIKTIAPYQVYTYALYSGPSYDFYENTIVAQSYNLTLQTGKYIIPIFRKTDNSDFTPEDLLPNVTIERVDALFNQIGGLNDMVIGVGDVPYYGLEKISFGINKDDFKCTKTLILSQTATQAGLNKYQQGLEIINGKILSFCDNTDADHLGYILDLTSLAQIGYIDVTNIGDCHCNNVQFTDVYFDVADNYPLIIISQFNARGVYTNNRAYVVRLQESGNNLIGTIVKTITPSESVVGSLYGASYAYNNTTRELIVYTNTFYFGTVEDETNKTNIFVYDFPDLIGGGDVVLGEPKRHFYLPYHILQGATIKNGMLIWPVQKVQYFNGVPVPLTWPQNVLEFVDLSNGVVKAFVPIERTLEPEGCCSYDNAIYVAYHKGDATGEQEALRIERFDFN